MTPLDMLASFLYFHHLLLLLLPACVSVHFCLFHSQHLPPFILACFIILTGQNFTARTASPTSCAFCMGKTSPLTCSRYSCLGDGAALCIHISSPASSAAFSCLPHFGRQLPSLLYQHLWCLPHRLWALCLLCCHTHYTACHINISTHNMPAALFRGWGRRWTGRNKVVVVGGGDGGVAFYPTLSRAPCFSAARALHFVRALSFFVLWHAYITANFYLPIKQHSSCTLLPH